LVRDKGKITRLSCFDGAKKAKGLAVIIDVFRAFSCAPLFFHYGAKRLILEADTERALELKRQISDSILVGEVNEVPIEGADMGNSPSEVVLRGKEFFEGRVVIHRTTAGVAGVHDANAQCDKILLGSFLIARATAEYIRKSGASQVSIVAMGARGKAPSPEDEACGDYMEHLLSGSPYDHVAAIEKIVFNDSAKKFTMGTQPYLPSEDPIFCLQRDIFDFALVVEEDDGLLQARPVRP